jgi:signal transduction histidine kinase
VRVILRQLLDFSRPPRIEHGPVSLADVARQVVELVSTQRPYERIGFEVTEDPSAGPAHGDASLASQILLNLVLNAAAALDGDPAARIRLDIRPDVARRRGRDRGEAGEARERADSVVCLVEDSGPGVPGALRHRIFDPFFTTKAPGQGTGLGLANARRLAEEMGGRVELDPTPSTLGGARFRFVLPVEAPAPDRPAGVRGAERPQSRMP